MVSGQPPADVAMRAMKIHRESKDLVATAPLRTCVIVRRARLLAPSPAVSGLQSVTVSRLRTSLFFKAQNDLVVVNRRVIVFAVDQSLDEGCARL